MKNIGIDRESSKQKYADWKAPDTAREEQRKRFEDEFRKRLEERILVSHRDKPGRKKTRGDTKWLEDEIKHSHDKPITFRTFPEGAPGGGRFKKIGFGLHEIGAEHAGQLMPMRQDTENREPDFDASLEVFLQAAKDNQDAAADFLDAHMQPELERMSSIVAHSEEELAEGGGVLGKKRETKLRD